MADINAQVIYSAAYAADESIREGVKSLYEARNEILNRCYAIDGYENMAEEEQDSVYDSIRDEVLAEFGLA